MTRVSDFAERERELLCTSPWVVGLAVACAEPGGTLRETFAIAGVVSAAAQRYPGNALIASLWDPPEAGVGGARRTPGGTEPISRAGQDRGTIAVPDFAVDACKRVSAALDARADAEQADGFRRFLADVALAVAEAAYSGGVLGIGGVRMTPAEKATVDAIRKALDLEPLTMDAAPAAGPPATTDPPAPTGEPLRPE